MTSTSRCSRAGRPAEPTRSPSPRPRCSGSAWPSATRSASVRTVAADAGRRPGAAAGVVAHRLRRERLDGQRGLEPVGASGPSARTRTRPRTSCWCGWRSGADVDAARARADSRSRGRVRRARDVPGVGREPRAAPVAAVLRWRSSSGCWRSRRSRTRSSTTVRRRRHDLAMLRSIGFTRRRHADRDRVAVDAHRGGRTRRRHPARDHRRAGPLEAAGRELPRGLRRRRSRSSAVLLVVPVAIVIANLVAAGPAHAATRIRPASASARSSPRVRGEAGSGGGKSGRETGDECGDRRRVDGPAGLDALPERPGPADQRVGDGERTGEERPVGVDAEHGVHGSPVVEDATTAPARRTIPSTSRERLRSSMNNRPFGCSTRPS